jgi:hypothetical protein
MSPRPHGTFVNAHHSAETSGEWYRYLRGPTIRGCSLRANAISVLNVRRVPSKMIFGQSFDGMARRSSRCSNHKQEHSECQKRVTRNVGFKRKGAHICDCISLFGRIEIEIPNRAKSVGTSAVHRILKQPECFVGVSSVFLFDESS